MNIYDKEYNELCFYIYSISNEKQLDKVNHYFTKESISELSLVQILKIISPFKSMDACGIKVENAPLLLKLV
jgi:hypothetical protein